MHLYAQNMQKYARYVSMKVIYMQNMQNHAFPTLLMLNSGSSLSITNRPVSLSVRRLWPLGDKSIWWKRWRELACSRVCDHDLSPIRYRHLFWPSLRTLSSGTACECPTGSKSMGAISPCKVPVHHQCRPQVFNIWHHGRCYITWTSWYYITPWLYSTVPCAI